MSTRRSHPKSRHGCTTCKRRKVKCDEQRPICSSCRLRGQPCDYSTLTPYIWPHEDKSREKDRRQIRTSKSVESDLSRSSPKASGDLLDRFGVDQRNGKPAPTLDLKQLELIVQWQSHTYKFFTRGTETEDIWRNLLVQEALRTPMLMHGILGVSALHLGLCRDASERSVWVDLAAAHNAEALRSFGMELSDINDSNAKAMLGFSSLVVAHAFGAALTDITDKPNLNTLTSIFSLCRGVMDIARTTSPFIRNGDFASLFVLSKSTVDLPTNPSVSLNRLETMNASLAKDPQHDFVTYAKAIKSLMDLSKHTYSDALSMTLAGGMPIQCLQPFLNYIQQREPFSLAILAHYCAFIHLAEGNLFIQPWGINVLRDICDSLDPSWRTSIEWPIREVFGKDEL